MEANGNAQVQLTPKQETFIALLLSGISIAGAARQAGIGIQTAHRWRKLPHFQVAYKAAQQQLFNDALSSLVLKVEKAIETLDRNMSGEDVPPSTQVRAAQIVLEQAITVHLNTETERRLDEIEALLQEDR